MFYSVLFNVHTFSNLQISEYTIDSITVEWFPPTINPVLHSEVLEYFVDCLPVAPPLPPILGSLIPIPVAAPTLATVVFTVPEGALVPVPCSPALPPSPLYDENAPSPLDYIYQKYIDATKPTSVRFTNLLPCSTYCIRLKCRSLSGWSVFSKRIIVQETLAYVPEPPEPVDICKISTNGLLLQWMKPHRDNGLPVDYYQIELIDAKLAVPIMQQERQAEIERNRARDERNAAKNVVSTTAAASSSAGKARQKMMHNRLPTASASTTALPTGVDDESSVVSVAAKANTNALASSSTSVVGASEKRGVASKWHRLIRHKNIHLLTRFVIIHTAIHSTICIIYNALVYLFTFSLV